MRQADLSKASILIAMIGGGKSGNIILPNPNTIVAAEAFKIDLSGLMVAGIIQSMVGLVATGIIASVFFKK